MVAGYGRRRKLMTEQEDEAGNKIPHTGSLSRLLHGEHVAHNVDQEGSGTHTKAKRVDEHK